MRLAHLLLSCLLLAACASAPPIAVRERAPREPIPAALLQDDIDVLEQAVTQLHPGVYRYNTPVQLRAGIAALRRELAHDATLPQAWLAFNRFTALLRCGHTYPNPVNQSAEVAARLFESKTRLPFHFRWLDGRMVVTRNFSGDPRLAPGTQVLAIDGVRSPELLAAMLPLVRADGYNDGKRISLLEVGGRERYESFDILHPLLYPQTNSNIALSVLPPDQSAPVALRVPAQTQAQRLAQRLEPPRQKGAPAWTLRRLDDGIALLDMPTWAIYDRSWDWRAWLQDAFEGELLATAPVLVIDLRDNEGGWDLGADLLAYLVASEQPVPGYLRKTRYRSSPPELRPYLDTWDRGFHDWGAAAVPMGDGFYRLERDGVPAEGERIAPQSPRYRGKVYVLISAVNSSATFEFARAVRRAGAGTLVGQATGGNLRGINGGAFFFMNLPNSRIEIDLPLIGLFPVAPQPDAGLQPDIAVADAAADFAAGRDAELAAVRRDLSAN